MTVNKNCSRVNIFAIGRRRYYGVKQQLAYND